MSMELGEAVNLLIDCDTGIDDALAILYLARQSNVRIIAAGSVHGNVSAQLGAINTLRVFELAGLGNIDVALVADGWLAQETNPAEEVHGRDGLGETNLPMPRRRPSKEAAAAQMVRVVHEHPGTLTILATAPLTNLAIALLLDPELPRLVHRVVVMGGAVYCPGNVTMDAEANIWSDPEAADLVFTAGWPITLVGLDVTMKAVLKPEDAGLLADTDSSVGRFAWAILQHYFEFHARYYGERLCHLHDPLAAGIVADPSLATYRSTPVRVELRGVLTRGSTRGNPPWNAAGPEGPPISVATEVDADRFRAAFLRALT